MAAIELSNIAAGAGGFVINGECKDDLAGYSVAAAGDINGDGLDDLIVGAPYADPAAGSAAGRAAHAGRRLRCRSPCATTAR